MNKCASRFCLSSLLFVWVVPLSVGLSADELADRIRRGDIEAIKMAGETGRTDLIVDLEVAYQLPGWWDRSAVRRSQQALAKLGVNKYWDEIIGELTNPVSSSAFQYELQSREGGRGNIPPSVQEKWAVRSIRLEALAKLSEVNHPAAVKFIAPLLYDQQPLDPAPHPGAAQPIAVTASLALSKMQLNGAPSTDDDFLQWQQWWEQHKDYYEKIEFGQPPPTPPPTMEPAVPTANRPAPDTKSPPPPGATTSPQPTPTAPRWLWFALFGTALVFVLGVAVFRKRR